MNQEELINIKAIARLMPESQARNHIFLLLANIDAQAGQIEALKEKLVHERIELIIRYAPEDCQFGQECDPAWCVHNEPMKCPQIGHYRIKARQQLKAEMPEVGWE